MIHTTRKLGLAALLASTVLTPALGIAPAFAADEPQAASAADTVETVTVTARRRSESLQNVPIAVTAFSADHLDQIGATDLTDLQQSTPNMTLEVARATNSTVVAYIRGVGQQDPLWGFEPGVGIYVDDVYIARPQGAVLDIYDVDHIEILRGPQGTLYGRNTIGGAIKYVTKRLGDQPTLHLRGQFGSYGETDGLITGSTPVTDTLSVGGALAIYKHDGYGKNVVTGVDQYDKDVMAGRVSAEWTPTSSLFFRFAADGTDDRSHAKFGHREVAPILSNVYDTAGGMPMHNRVKTAGWSLLGQWTLNPAWTFKSITAYRTGTTETNIDFDSLPVGALSVPGRYSDHQFTEEAQVLYENGPIHGVAGFFYLNSYAAGAFDTSLSLLNLVIGTAGNVYTTSYAGYADVSYDITDKFSVSGGLRWTQDEKTGSVYRANYLGLVSPLFGGTAVLLPPVHTDYTKTRTFTATTPHATASYKFNPDLTAYASYGEGFKSGGFDMRGDALLTPDTTKGYNPEFVDTYEAGLKGAFFDRRLSLNAAVFYSKYRGQQVTVQVPTGGGGIASFVDNVGDSHIEGAELEGSALLTDALTANFSVGYVKGTYDKYTTYDITTHSYIDVSKQRVFQNTPEWDAYLGLTYQRELPNSMGLIAVTGAASYRGETHMFEIPTPAIDQSAYTLLNADVVWTSESGRYGIGLHAKNLTDKHYRVGGYNFPGAVYGDSVTAFYGPPRTFLATFDLHL